MTTADLETPADWGDSPMDEEEWAVVTRRKRPTTAGEEYPRSAKAEAPATLENRFEVLGGLGRGLA